MIIVVIPRKTDEFSEMNFASHLCHLTFSNGLVITKLY